VRGLVDTHAVEPIDRLLTNRGVVLWDIFDLWVRQVVRPREETPVAMDWTDLDADDQTTLALNLVACHASATPLIWLSWA